MTDRSRISVESTFLLRVLSHYVRLVPPEAPDEPSLGGQLLYAGELDEDGRALVVASNIAGAASLCATADANAQKQAIHDGIVDFLVTSLDEALRILKNEIRKRAPVAVCIGAPPAEIDAQMAERGVVPDIFRTVENAEDSRSMPADIALVSWSVSSAPARWMPKLDAFAIECADELPESARRWLRTAPRYLARLAQSIHVVLADTDFAARFMEGAMVMEESRIPLRLQVSYRGASEEFTSPNWNKDNQSLVPSP